MISVDTVFVIGAGASSPYGYPTGEGLKNNICNLSAGTYQGRVRNGADVASFVSSFRNSGIKSIDKYLAINPDYSEIGKIFILYNIFYAESKSRFGMDMLKENKDYDWYTYLYNRMTESFDSPESISEFSNNKVSFITFNYDRSLEYFLYKSLSNTFKNANDNKIYEQINKINIHHVYGKIANMPWEENGIPFMNVYKSNLSINFSGIELDYNQIKFDAIAENIRVINERSNSNIEEIRRLIRECKRIYFLGFSYADENLKALDIDKNIDGHKKIYGTGKGLTEGEINRVKKSFRFHLEITHTARNLYIDGNENDSVMLLRNELH